MKFRLLNIYKLQNKYYMMINEKHLSVRIIMSLEFYAWIFVLIFDIYNN